MNSKSISKALSAKLNDWCKHIDDENVIAAIKENAIITGGAIVSLLNNEKPNDYDVYFKTIESCTAVVDYYINKWNESSEHANVRRQIENGRIMLFIGNGANGNGTTLDDNADADNEDEPYATEYEDSPTKANPTIEEPRYRPRYFSTNALSLSDDIQIIIRFYGSIEEIHKNYDFEHCKCSYDYCTNEINLPVKALECIINKELYYSGSKYPLCSIIRTRKFIERGWHINAGQYVKMALQLNELDLKDLNVFRDQLVGVDSAYFSAALDAIAKHQANDPNFKIDNTYLFEVINRIF